MIYIDMDHPRIVLAENQSFWSMEAMDFLEKFEVFSMQSIRKKIQRGFYRISFENELIEDFALEINLSDGSRNSLRGFYTIAEKT